MFFTYTRKTDSLSIIRFTIVLTLISILCFFITCERFEPAHVLIIHTDSITEVSYSSCKVTGIIVDVGSAGIAQHGFCWSESRDPDVNSDSITDLGPRNSKGSFVKNITGLSPGTNYYIKAYGTNEDGIVYGKEKSFITVSILPPSVSTTIVSYITQTSSQSGGDVTDDGGASVIAKGVCWSISENPTLSDSYTTNGNGVGDFTSVLSGLACGTTYYVRAYATNSAGTAYGNQVDFTTNQCTADPPSVTTSTVINISEITAQSGGDVTDDGGASVTAKGVCWSTSESPTLSDSYTTNGNGVGDFTSVLSGLTCGTTYYVRAYATNSAGTAYGNQVDFTTNQCTADPPSVTTSTVINISETTAQSGGDVTDDGGASVTAKGVCWSTSESPTITDSHTTDGSSTGSYTSAITGLACGTTYYVRAYATNSSGTAYGNQEVFTTNQCPIDLPTVTTSSIINVTLNSAQGGGNVTSDGGAEVTAKGVCWSTSTNPIITDSHTTDGSGTGGFTSAITGLACGTTYYVRAYATNISGTAYGIQLDFTTNSCPALPSVIVTEISNIAEYTAESGGEVTADGGATVTARGVCWSTYSNPTIDDNKTINGSGTGSFSSSLIGLDPYTTYYVRAYATNITGTNYSEEKSFRTFWDNSTVTDYDENVYNTVQIGDQVWMKENMKAVHLPDGEAITLIEDSVTWNNLGPTAKAYCYYNNNSASVYGVLYSWPAFMNGASSSDNNPSGIQGVCPGGWHVPSDEEWKELEMYLGMSRADADDITYRGTDEGGKLKDTGTELWRSPNLGATNETGFTAIPGGYRDQNGEFSGSPGNAYFWTSSEYISEDSWYRAVRYDNSGVGRYYCAKSHGFAVRCLKDE